METLIDRNNLLNKGFALFKKACDEATNEEVFKAVQKIGGEFEKLIKSAPAVEVPSWIPVTERLPSEDDMNALGEVLVMSKGDVCTAVYLPSESIFCRHGYRRDDITRWMPMPKAHKEVE